MLLLLLLTSGLGERPPVQTAKQKELLNYWEKNAPALSEDARQVLIDYLSGHTFKVQIENTTLAWMTAESILAWIVHNVKSSPFVHTFSYTFMKYLKEWGYAPTVWNMQVAKVVNYSKTQDTAEQKLMHYKPFANPELPTPAEAYDRPQYLSVGIWRPANGDDFYGELNLVLHPTKKNRCIIAPVDTGGYAQDCIKTEGTNGGKGHGNCSIWSKEGYPFATTKDFLHEILRHNNYYEYPLVEILKRWLDYPQNDTWYYHHYYEAELMGSFYLPEDLHFIVADFKIFRAADVQEFASGYKKPLLWSGDVNYMVLDPVVADAIGGVGGANITQDDRKLWQKFWTNTSVFWGTVMRYWPTKLTTRYVSEGICWREWKFDYSGADIAKIQTPTADLCCNACDATAACRYWTWRDFGDVRGRCQLKGPGYNRKADASAVSGRRSGCTPVTGRHYIGITHDGDCLWDL